MPKSWYRIQNSGDKQVTVSIHDEIGYWGISAKDFLRDWQAIPADAQITLSIHSPGGEVFDGLAIYHAVERVKDRVTARVEGWAASAASFIAMGAGKIVMPENAWLMIHNPASWAWGESSDLRKAADLLDDLEQTLVNIYSKRTGLAYKEISDMLNNETWLNGSDALEKGFIDEIEDAVSIAACASRPAADRLRSISNSLPQEVKASLAEVGGGSEVVDPPVNDDPSTGSGGPDNLGDEAGDPPAGEATTALRAEDIVAACEAAGYAFLALDLVQAGVDQEALDARLADAQSITTICNAGDQPEAAEKLIAAGISVPDAAAKLIEFRASSAPNISNAQSGNDEFFTVPATQQKPKPTSGKQVDAREIYNRRGKNRA